MKIEIMPTLKRWARQWGYLLAVVVALILISALLVFMPVYSSQRPSGHKAPAHVSLATPSPTPTTTVSQSGDWKTYMADNARSGFNGAETLINPTTAPHLELKWTHTAGAYVASQVVEADGLLYWGSWDGFEYATDLNNKTIWATNLGETKNSLCVPVSIGVTSTATIASVEIKGIATLVDFVGGGNGKFYALDAHTGAVIWQVSLGSPPAHYLWSSPAVYQGSVYIGVSSLSDCPLIQGKLVQLNAASGSIQHTFNVMPKGCIGGSIWSSPTIDEASGSVYISTGNGDECESAAQYVNALVELRASDLSLLHFWRLPLSETLRDGDFGTTPTLFKTSAGVPMVGLENKNGKYYAFKRDQLDTPVWRTRIAIGRGSISSSAWDGQRLYVAGRTVKLQGVQCPGSLAALNPDTGAIIWQDCLKNASTPEPATGVLGEMVSGAVAAVPGLVAYAQGPYVMLFDAVSGKVLFSYHDTGEDSLFRGWASISNGVLYIGNANGKLYAFAPEEASTGLTLLIK